MTANADTFVGWLIIATGAIWLLADRWIVLLAWIDRGNEERDVVEVDVDERGAA